MSVKDDQYMYEINRLEGERDALLGSFRRAQQIADKYLEQLDKLHGENARLREFVAGQVCECLDEYGNRKPKVCERCRLLGRIEDEFGTPNQGGGV